MIKTIDRFDQLLSKLKTQYSWILAATKLSPQSAEAESLMFHFPIVSVTLTDEMVNHLDFFEQMKKRHPDQLLTFVLASTHDR